MGGMRRTQNNRTWGFIYVRGGLTLARTVMIINEDGRWSRSLRVNGVIASGLCATNFTVCHTSALIFVRWTVFFICQNPTRKVSHGSDDGASRFTNLRLQG